MLPSANSSISSHETCPIHCMRPLLSLSPAARTGTVCQQPCRRGFPEAYSILGDWLIAAVPTNPTTTTQTNSYGGTSTTAFYTLAHVLSGDTQATPLGTSPARGVRGTPWRTTLYVSVLAGEVTDQSGVVSWIMAEQVLRHWSDTWGVLHRRC